jgi:hypothetical protein
MTLLPSLKKIKASVQYICRIQQRKTCYNP